MDKQLTYYYVDEVNDEVIPDAKSDVEIDKNFKYERKGFLGALFNICSFFVYRIIMTPIAFIQTKIKYRLKVVGKEKLKPFKKHGYFVYGNHTLFSGDAFVPNVVNFPKKTYVVVKSANLSTKGTKNFILMNGAIPLPTKISAMKNFLNILEKRTLEGCAVMIYPEAHVWPYYTKIRDFKSTSFKYPVQYLTPCFSTTVTYGKRKNSIKPNVTVYVDGPFYPDGGLSQKDQVENLRNKVYNAMCERAKNSDYEYAKYVKKSIPKDDA